MKANTVTAIKCQRFKDERGWFSESYNRQAFEKIGLTQQFVQDNHSLSRSAGTIRGLHLQRPPHAQAKLVRCIRGHILDVAVDIRVGSPSFGKYVATELTENNSVLLYVPVGFAHGFATLADNTEVIYKVTDYYAPESDDGLRWDDPALAINWRVPGSVKLILSNKDSALPLLRDFKSPFTFEMDDVPLDHVQEVTL